MMRKLGAAFVAVMMVVGLWSGQAWAADPVEHGAFDKLLEEYVDSRGQVDYAGLKKNEEDRARLRAYVEALGAAKVEPKGEAALAFFLNAYNANVIDKVVAAWPVESVMKEDNFFKREDLVVAGQKTSLDALEHRLIRPKFEDARIHFVLVCAAKSCPRLRQKAFTEGNVERELERAAREFVPKATSLKDGQVVTSQLFNWFADDFKRDAGSVQAYLLKYIGETEKNLSLRKALEAKKELKFSKYDWAINKQ